MKYIMCLFTLSATFELSRVPVNGSSPKGLSKPTAVYCNYTDEILIFGGQEIESQQYSSSIFSFNLQTFTWGEVVYGSDFRPPGLIFAQAFMQSYNKMIVMFGTTVNEISSKCFSFDLDAKTWQLEELKGDKVYGRIASAYCEFEYNYVKYLAVYGGVTINGESDELFLYEIFRINVETLTAEKIESINGPGHLNEATLVYSLNALFLFKDTFLYKLDLDSLIWTPIELELEYGISFHKSFAINDLMYVFFGYDPLTFSLSTKIIQVNLTDYSTKQVFSDDRPAIFQASIQINRSIYLLFGQGASSYLNSINKYEINESSIKKTVLIENASFPSKRRNHASFQFDNEIYIFGGISSTGEYLNDMWRFNIEKNIWTKLNTVGTIPDGRELMAYQSVVGFGLVFFGGRSSIVHSDAFFFQTKGNFWYILLPVNSEPPARYSSCTINLGLKMILISGRNENMGFYDIWVYDTLYNNYTKVTTSDLPFSLVDHKCFLQEIDSNEVDIYVFGGSNLEYIPNNNIYKVHIKGFNSFQFEVSTEIVLSNPYLTISDSPLIPHSDYLMLVSGSKYRNYINPFLITYNISTNTLEFEELPSELALFGHSAVHIGKSIYIFGGGLSNSGYKIDGSTSNTFYKLTWDELRCGYGSEGTNCEPCNKGFVDFSGTCSPCPAGTYSDVYGASNYIECIPCPYGTFNDRAAARYCKNCSPKDFCPIGSVNKKNMYFELTQLSKQPGSYEEPKGFLLKLENTIWYIVIGIVSIFTFAIIFSSSLTTRLKKIDLFVSSHSQDLGTPVILRQTALGGLFSFYFFIVAISTIIFSIITLLYNNVSEIKTLVPLITVSEEVTSSFLKVNFDIYDFKGNCEINSTCSSSNEIHESGFSFSSKNVVCETSDSKCSIHVYYFDVLLKSDCFVNFTAKDDIVSSTLFTVEIETASSIPNENSTTFLPVYPEDKKKIFRGMAATLINYEFIPSVIKN